MTFTVEIRDAQKTSDQTHQVEIYLDQENLDLLISQLKLLVGKEEGEHTHFFSDSWGGVDLTEDPVVAGNVISHHLRITIAK